MQNFRNRAGLTSTSGPWRARRPTRQGGQAGRRRRAPGAGRRWPGGRRPARPLNIVVHDDDDLLFAGRLFSWVWLALATAIHWQCSATAERAIIIMRCTKYMTCVHLIHRRRREPSFVTATMYAKVAIQWVLRSAQGGAAAEEAI